MCRGVTWAVRKQRDQTDRSPCRRGARLLRCHKREVLNLEQPIQIIITGRMMVKLISNRFIVGYMFVLKGEFNFEVQHTSKVKDVKSFPLILRRPESGKLLGISLFPPVNGLEWMGLYSSPSQRNTHLFLFHRQVRGWRTLISNSTQSPTLISSHCFS